MVVESLTVELIGGSTQKIDSKGRMVLPVRYRDALGQQVYATVGTDTCIAVYTAEKWNEILPRLRTYLSGSGASRDFARIILSHAFELEVDGMGRILIPQPLREYAGAQQEVWVNGLDRQLEIWDLKTWNDYSKPLMAKGNLRSLAEQIGGL